MIEFTCIKRFVFEDFSLLSYGNNKKFVINTHDFSYCTFIQAIARDLEIEDDNGNKMPAMKVFSACISYLRQHMTDACNSRHVDIEDDEIQWVLTVPAIWTDGAKQFMREAAIRVVYLCIL